MSMPVFFCSWQIIAGIERIQETFRQMSATTELLEGQLIKLRKVRDEELESARRKEEDMYTKVRKAAQGSAFVGLGA